MRRPDIFSYRLRGNRMGGSTLDMLRFAQAYPSGPHDADTIYKLIVADSSGDYGLYFSTKDPVEFQVSSPIATNGDHPGFPDIVARWASFGWEVMIYNNFIDEYEKYDPTNARYYGVRR